MEADRIQFPVFVIHTDNVEEIDGITWIDDQVLDDKNMSGEEKYQLYCLERIFSVFAQIQDNRHECRKAERETIA